MDAFEALVAEALWAEGYWVQTSVKVKLTKEDKAAIKRPSCPDWELDVAAYKPKTNELLIVECKSYIDSKGVQWSDFKPESGSSRYKLFQDEILRGIIFDRLELIFTAAGLCRKNPKRRLGLAAGKIKGKDAAAISARCNEMGWRFMTPDDLKTSITTLATGSYRNSMSSIVAKLLLR